MGADEWRDEREWPLARTRWTRFYLHSQGQANSLNGDGRLSAEAPAEEPPDRFEYDPADPVPTIGGRGLLPVAAGIFDHSELEQRRDILVYSTSPLTRLLVERCRQRPLVLLLDEAHTLNRDIGQALLNASQTVSAEAPFMLVIAGTPGLQAHPNAMSATFWSRGKQIGVGLLDEASATEALTQPLAEQEPPIVIDDAALGRLGLRLEGARG